jgi:hypothetical protein
VTHTYIKPSSNQRSTTSREASAAGRLRSSRIIGQVKKASENDLSDYQGLSGAIPRTGI